MIMIIYSFPSSQLARQPVLNEVRDDLADDGNAAPLEALGILDLGLVGRRVVLVVLYCKVADAESVRCPLVVAGEASVEELGP
jgi:hypothetical protein